MPNIIEQQDLLKGLPDARLAMLLQRPVAEIPPFLVAAEAQRRQAIRQQFAGQGENESVVDTLTKQLSNVPQNIQAPLQTPPTIPQTPQMQGVAALQQQMQQGGEGQQIMRNGGMVQRYYDGGKVQPWWKVPDISSTVSSGLGYLGSKVSDLAEWATTPYSERDAKDEEKSLIDTMTPEELADFNASVALPDVPIKPKMIDPGKEDTSSENKIKSVSPSQEGTPDDARSRLEKILSAQEPSDWEKSQRWFAMAEQLLDPSKTTMQSIASAGRAFAEQSAAFDAAKREAELNKEKGLLEYDIDERNRVREAEAERAKREYETQQKILERRNPPAADVLRTLGSLVEDINKRIESMKEIGSMANPDDIKRLEEQKNAYMIQMSEILKSAGYGPGSTITLDQLEALAGQ